MVWNSPHLGGLGGREENSIYHKVSASSFRQLVLESFIRRPQIGSPHDRSGDSWAKVTLEICDSGGRSCFIHSTEVKYKGKGERTDLCRKCHSGCNLSRSELCLSEGLVTLRKSLLSGCYYCSQFPNKISLLSSPAVLPLAEKKQNLCLAARAAKLKVRVQRRIAASPGPGLDLTRGTGVHQRGTAGDLRRHSPGNKPKRKHPSKMQIGEREGFLLLFSSYAGGLAVFFLLLLGHSGKRNLVYPKGQGKVNLKKIINTLNSSVCPTVQMFPPCQILPLAEKKKKIKENRNCNPKHLFCRFLSSPWAGKWVQLVHWEISRCLWCCWFCSWVESKSKTKKPSHIKAKVPVHRA